MKHTLVALFLTFAFTQTLSDSPVTSQYKKDRTTYNGVTFESAVGYLPLTASDTVRLPVQQSDTYYKNLNYTIMAWFKVALLPQVADPVLILSLDDQIACLLDSDFIIICEFSDYSRMTVKLTPDILNQWFHFTFSTSTQGNAYIQLETNHQVTRNASATRIFMKQTKPDQRFCFGRCIQSIKGFTGGIRELVFSNSFVDSLTASSLKNMILPYSSDLKAYYRFQGSTQIEFISDQYSANRLNSSKPFNQKFDMLPVDVCPGTYNLQEFYQITQSNQLRPFKVETVLLQNNYSYTMILTLQIDLTTCFTNNLKTAIASCNLVNFDQVFMLYFEKPNLARIHFFAYKNYFETQSVSFFVPFNQILTIQMSLTQKSGYQVFVFNQWGQLTNSFKNQIDLQKQIPGQQLTLFQGLEGVVKTFKLFNQQISLPKYRNITQTPIIDFDFSITWVYSQSLINMGSEKGFIQFSASPSTIRVPYRNFLETSSSTFDGITCKNNQLTLQLNSHSSFLNLNIAGFISSKNQSTIEFWFKLQNLSTYNTTGFIFQLQDPLTKLQFWQIFLTNGKLMVAPFGLSNITSPTITIPDFAQRNEDESGWWHLSCGYAQADTASCTIYNTKIQVQYATFLAGTTYFVPNSTLTASFGKINGTSLGVPQLLVKEFRYWNKRVTLQELQKNRYRQLDPTSLVGLTAYVRLIGGLDNFMLDLVQLSNGQSSLINTNSFDSVSMVPDFIEYNQTVIDRWEEMGQSFEKRQFHIICPLQTYYFEKLKACLSQPINEVILAVFPYFGSDGRLAWLFTVEYSAVLNETTLGQLQIKWDSDDYYLDTLLQRTPTLLNKLISSDVLRQETLYSVSADFQNSFGSSLGKRTVNFLPDRCHWFEVDGYNAYSGKRLLNVVQGVQDISFFLVHRQIKNCNAFDYFDSFDSLTFKFFISNGDQFLTQQPQATYDAIYQSDTLVGINVTLPSEEQLKLPSWTDVKILMTLSWRGNNTVQNLQLFGKDTVFQHSMFQLNFSPTDIKLVAALLSSSNELTMGQDLLLDASNTTATNMLPNLLRKSLNFAWQCPSEFQSLCLGQNSSKLVLPWTRIVRLPIRFGTLYTISLTTTLIQSQQARQNQTLSVQIVWYNATRPAFTIQYSPQPVLVSANRTTTFQLSTANFNLSTELSNYNFYWQIIPQLNQSTLVQYLQLGSQMRVPQGLWQTNTQYNVTLKVSLQSQPGIHAQSSVTFTTGGPPTDGKVEFFTTSDSGQFTIFVSGWNSQLGLPLFYNVFNTFDTSGQQRSNQINSAPLPVNQTLDVNWTSVNPLQVIVFDVSGESVLLTLSKQKQNTAQNQTFANNTTDINQNTTSNQIATTNSTLNGSSTNDANITHNSNNTSNQSQALQNFTQNNQTVEDQFTNFSSSSSVATDEDIGNHTLSNVTDTTQGRNLQILKGAFQGEEFIFHQTSANLIQTYDRLSSEQPGLEKQYLSLLDIAITVSDENDFQDTLNQVLSRLKNITDQFAYQSDAIDSRLIVQSNPYLDAYFQDSHITVNQNLYKTQEAALMRITRIKSPKQYSVISLQSTDQQGLIFYEITSPVKIEFAYTANNFNQNQTNCAVSSLNSDLWSIDACLTEFDPEKSLIICTCNMMQSDLITVKNDFSRIIASQIKSRSLIILQQNLSMQGSSYLLLSLMVALLIGNLIGAFTTWQQDRKSITSHPSNYFFYQQEENFIRAVSDKLCVELSYVRSRLASFKTYTAKSASRKLIVTCDIHPLLSPFLGRQSCNKLTSFCGYMTQINLYAGACLYYFGDRYRNFDFSRQIGVIDSTDISRVSMFIFLAGFFLLPFASTLMENLFQLSRDHKSDTNRLLHSLVQLICLGSGIIVCISGITNFRNCSASNQLLAWVSILVGILFATFFTNFLRVHFNFYAFQYNRKTGLLLSPSAIQTLNEIEAAQECAELLYSVNALSAAEISRPHNLSNSQTDLVISDS